MAYKECRVFCIIVLLALLPSGGCIYSDHALSTRESVAPDRELAGLWRLECEPGDMTCFHVLISPSGGMKLVRVIHPGENSKTAGSAEEFSAFSTIIDKKHYLNVSVPVPDEENHRTCVKFMFFRYEFKDRNRLIVTMPSYEAVQKSIEANALKGKAWETTWGSNAEISDTPGKLAQWLASLDMDRGLVQLGTMTRIE